MLERASPLGESVTEGRSREMHALHGPQRTMSVPDVHRCARVDDGLGKVFLPGGDIFDSNVTVLGRFTRPQPVELIDVDLEVLIVDLLPPVPPRCCVPNPPDDQSRRR